jgi:hypothetical protein
MTKEQEKILRKIEGLQETRKYAAPEERARLTAAIERLFKLYDKAGKEHG